MAIAESKRDETVQALRPGMTFGSYDIVRCIGIGGMGSVFEAVHRLMQRRVALKVLHASIPTTHDVDPRERFLREGAMLVRVEHPNVVEVFDAGVVDGMPFIAMELLEGVSFDRLSGGHGRLPPKRAVDLVADAAEGLEAAHQVGIVHRDVKPENLFITRDARGREVAKLVDFGIAKDFRGGGGRNTAIGTPAYMSPEQLLGGHPIDGRCDQYSLGVVLYEALAGSRPYDAPSLVELAIRLERGDAEPPSARGVPISAALDAVVMRAIAVDPEQRFPSMAAFAAALRASVTNTVDFEYGDVDRPTAPPPDPARETEPTRTIRRSSFPPPKSDDPTARLAPIAIGNTPSDDERARLAWYVAGGIVLLAAAIGIGAVLGGRTAPRDATPSSTSTSTSSPPTQTGASLVPSPAPSPAQANPAPSTTAPAIDPAARRTPTTPRRDAPPTTAANDAPPANAHEITRTSDRIRRPTMATPVADPAPEPTTTRPTGLLLER